MRKKWFVGTVCFILATVGMVAYGGNASIMISKPGMAVHRWDSTNISDDYLAKGGLRIGDWNSGWFAPVYRFHVPSLGSISSLSLKVNATEHNSGSGEGTSFKVGDDNAWHVYTSELSSKTVQPEPYSSVSAWIQGESDADTLMDYVEITFDNDDGDDIEIDELELTIEYAGIAESNADLIAKFQLIHNLYSILETYHEEMSPILTAMETNTYESYIESGIQKSVAVASALNEMNGFTISDLDPSYWGSWVSKGIEVSSCIDSFWNLWQSMVDLITTIPTVNYFYVQTVSDYGQDIADDLPNAISKTEQLLIEWQLALNDNGDIDGADEMDAINIRLDVALDKLADLRYSIGKYTGYVLENKDNYTSLCKTHIQLVEPLRSYDSEWENTDYLIQKYMDLLNAFFFEDTLELINGSVSPASGDLGDSFDFTVDYRDANGSAPVSAKVFIGGSGHLMSRISGTDANGTYQCQTALQTTGEHSYYFEFENSQGATVRLPATGVFSGPTVSTPPGSETIIRYAVEDSYTASGDFSDYNYGSASLFLAGSDGTSVNYSYLKFNLSSIPDGSTVTGAKLEMYCEKFWPSENGNTEVHIGVNGDSWQQNSITWNNQPASGTGVNVWKSVPSVGWLEFEHDQIKDVVAEWVSGSRNNYGFRLYGIGTTSFRSSEQNSYKPKLIISYTPPPKPDLIVTHVTPNTLPSNGEYYVGDRIRWNTTVKNIGEGTADSSEVRYGLSTSPTRLNKRVGDDGVGTLNTAEADDESQSYTFQKIDVGYQYLVCKADWDNSIAEEAEGNNWTAYGPFTVIPLYHLSVVNGNGSTVFTNITRNATINADPASAGKVFTGWTVSPATYAGNLADASAPNTTFTVPTDDVTLTANYESIISDAGLIFQQVAYADGDTLPDLIRLRGHLVGGHFDLVRSATLTTPLGTYAYQDSGAIWSVRKINMSIEEFASQMVGSTCLIDVVLSDSSTVQYAISVPSDAELPMPQVPVISISGMDAKGYVDPSEDVVVSWEPWPDALPSGGISVWIEVEGMEQDLSYWLESSATSVSIPAGTFPESPHGSVFINFRNNGEGTTQNGTPLVVDKESGADVIFHTMDMSTLHPDFMVERWDILDVQPFYAPGDVIEAAFSVGIATNSEMVQGMPLKVVLSLDRQMDWFDYVFFSDITEAAWIEGSTRDPDPPVFEIPEGMVSGDYYFGIILDEDELFGDPDRSNNIGWATNLVQVRLPSPTDVDGDGLPDIWESAFFSGSIAAEAGYDFDEDGLSNIEEYISGTDPTNSASTFSVSSSSVGLSGTLYNVVTWMSVSNRNYCIQWASGLEQPFSVLESGIPYPQSSYTDMVHSVESCSFYKVDVELDQ